MNRSSLLILLIACVTINSTFCMKYTPNHKQDTSIANTHSPKDGSKHVLSTEFAALKANPEAEVLMRIKLKQANPLYEWTPERRELLDKQMAFIQSAFIKQTILCPIILHTIESREEIKRAILPLITAAVIQDDFRITIDYRKLPGLPTMQPAEKKSRNLLLPLAAGFMSLGLGYLLAKKLTQSGEQ